MSSLTDVSQASISTLMMTVQDAPIENAQSAMVQMLALIVSMAIGWTEMYAHAAMVHARLAQQPEILLALLVLCP